MEWRTFATEGDTRGNAADPNRVGGPTNPLLKDGLTTSIQQGAKGAGGALAASLQRTAARAAAGAPGHESDRALLDGMRRIGRLSDDLQLVKGARDRACLLYKQVLERAKGVRSRGAANVAAAVVYIACRQEGAPRTFKEIVAASAASVAAGVNAGGSSSNSPSAERLDKRDIARAYKAIVRDLEAVMGIVHAGDLTRRFCSQLGVPRAATRAAAAAAEAACPRDGSRPSGLSKPWDGKSPLSQAAAIIFLVTRCPRAMSTEEEEGKKGGAAGGGGGVGGGGGGEGSGDAAAAAAAAAKAAAALAPPPVPADIALVAGVTESTLRSTARDMFPDLREIIPEWFATDAELREVECP